MPTFEAFSVVARLLAGAWLLWRVRSPERWAPPALRRRVSIVIPARNEEHSISLLLASLAPELRGGDEVIVVDDHSSDATAAAAAVGGAKVLASPPLPAGWTGKAWACATGAERASNPLLVFLDADVVVEPGGLDRILGEYSALGPAGGLFSVQPFHRTERTYERLSAMFNVVSMMGTDAFTPLGDRRAPRGAFGPCLVTSAAAYRRVGGHAAVAGEVLDDVALAGRYREAGLGVRLRGGRGSVAFRMYPQGLGQLVEGWSKNFAGGAGATRRVTLALAVAWISVLIQTSWWLGRLAFTGDGPGSGAGFTLAAYAACVAQLTWMLRRVGRFGATSPLLYPIGVAFFLGTFARSLVLTLARRSVRWKGRDVPVGEVRRAA